MPRAPGATLASAQAEMMLIAERAAAASRGRPGELRLRVVPYTREHLDLTQPALVWILRSAQILIGALAFVVAINLAILNYARTVTRLGEIAVRTALGAGRRRILSQLFVEAFALSGLGAAAGLLLAHLALDALQDLAAKNGSVPFWLRFDLSPATGAFALVLAAVAAAIMGVLPGLRATGRRFAPALHALNGRGGTRLGPMWTALVVAQVAIAVAVLPAAASLSWQIVRMELVGPGFPAEQYVVGAALMSDVDGALTPDRIRSRQLDLVARLSAEPGVSGVTFSSSVPGFAAGGRRIEFDDGRGWVEGPEVSTLHVGLELFDVYEADLVAGRVFAPGDLGAARAVIVNQSLAQRLPPGRSVLGLRFRDRPDAGQPGGASPWYQIVGVVQDFPRFAPSLSFHAEPTVYHPAVPGDLSPVILTARFPGGVPADIAERIRQIGAEVDPSLQLRRVVPLSTYYHDVRSVWRYVAWGIAAVTTSVLLLSAAGIYALLSFTVAQRSREIGIRAALGAAPRRLLLNIFSRVTGQLGIGVLAGSLLSAAAFSALDVAAARSAPLVALVAGLMAVVGLLAGIGPARRGLRIQPSEALRD